MCIIVIQPKGHVFDDYAIYDFYDRNPHGFGFMWADGKGVHGVRGVFTGADAGDEAIAAYHKYAAGVAGVLHYRYATSGPVDNTMAHPFAVSKDLLVVHNGVLPGGNSKESDTYQFVENTLKPLLGADYHALQDPEVLAYLEAMVKGSSVVFMDRDGTITRLGSKGVEYDGCWYSNTYAWTLPPELGGPGLWSVDAGWGDEGLWPVGEGGGYGGGDGSPQEEGDHLRACSYWDGYDCTCRRLRSRN